MLVLGDDAASTAAAAAATAAAVAMDAELANLMSGDNDGERSAGAPKSMKCTDCGEHICTRRHTITT